MQCVSAGVVGVVGAGWLSLCCAASSMWSCVTIARHHPGEKKTTENTGRMSVTHNSHTPEAGRDKNHFQGMHMSCVSLLKTPGPGMQLWLPIKCKMPPEDRVNGHDWFEFRIIKIYIFMFKIKFFRFSHLFYFLFSFFFDFFCVFCLLPLPSESLSLWLSWVESKQQKKGRKEKQTMKREKRGQT